MKAALGQPPALGESERQVRRRLAWEPPMLPGLTPGTVRRWENMATWQPPETVVLARHRAHGRSHWIFLNRRDSPPGYELEFDLGLVQRHEQPGTRRLEERDGTFVLADAAVEPGTDVTVLGHLEQAPFPMMDLLELRRVATTGQHVLVAGADDPLFERSEPVALLGHLESFPVQPRRLLAPSTPPRGLTLLARCTDAQAWSHAYDTVEWADRQRSVAGRLVLGSIWTRPAPGFVELWREADGRLRTALLDAGRTSRRPRPMAATRWMAAPLTWSQRPHLWAVRAAGSRARHLVARDGNVARGERERRSLGHLRATPAPGHVALYSAAHPVLPDQFVTRSRLEALDMGFRIEGVLGYIGDLGADRHRGPDEVLWGSRFGHQRRYRED